MGSTVAGLMLLALLAQPGVASAAPVDVSGAFGGFRASAQWWLPPESDGVTQTYAFAEVYQPATTTDGSGIAVIGIGNCVKSDSEADGRICRGAGFPHELVAGELELSPTLDSARVDYVEAGGRYHVTWKATDAAPTITPAHERGEHTVAAGGKIFRNAVADGTIRGLAFDRAVDRAADLSRGGAFGATFRPDGRRASRPFPEQGSEQSQPAGEAGRSPGRSRRGGDGWRSVRRWAAASLPPGRQKA